MDILALRVLVHEDEVNQHLPQLIPADAGVQNLRVRLTPEGVVVQGEYPTFMVKMSFETQWELAVARGLVQARLGSIKVAGLPAKLLRGVLMKVIRDATAPHQGVHVEEEALCIDVAKVLQAKQIPVHVQVTAVRCGPGHLVIEAGEPELA
jgi:hypothetical protein